MRRHTLSTRCLLLSRSMGDAPLVGDGDTLMDLTFFNDRELATRAISLGAALLSWPPPLKYGAPLVAAGFLAGVTGGWLALVRLPPCAPSRGADSMDLPLPLLLPADPEPCVSPPSPPSPSSPPSFRPNSWLCVRCRSLSMIDVKRCCMRPVINASQSCTPEPPGQR